jgi:hypothetical protein
LKVPIIQPGVKKSSCEIIDAPLVIAIESIVPKWKRHWLKTLPAGGVPVLPPAEIPPVALPPVELPPLAFPPVALPPVALPPVALPPVPPATVPPPGEASRLPLDPPPEEPPTPASREPPIELLVDAIVAPPLPPLAVVFGLVTPPVLAGPVAPPVLAGAVAPPALAVTVVPPVLLLVLPPDAPAVPSEPPALTVPAIALEPSASLPPVDTPPSWLGAHPDAAR